MPSFATVTTGRGPVDLYAFTGVVADQEKSSYTEVTRNNNNNVATSSTTHYNTIFVRNEAGEERSVQIVDSGLALRAGSHASFIWGIPKGKEKGDYMVVINHDTGAMHTIRKAVNDLAGPPFYNMLLILAVIVGCVGLFDLFSGDLGSAIILIGIGAGAVYWIYKGQKALLAQVESAVRAMKA